MRSVDEWTGLDKILLRLRCGDCDSGCGGPVQRCRWFCAQGAATLDTAVRGRRSFALTGSQTYNPVDVSRVEAKVVSSLVSAVSLSAWSAFSLHGSRLEAVRAMRHSAEQSL